MSKADRAPEDGIDRIVAEWGEAFPWVDSQSLEISARIIRLALVMNRHSESVCREYGFGFGEYDLLMTLRRGGPPYARRPTDLSEASLVTSGATTGRIDRLAALGLVERVDSSSDRRATDVRLTGRGKEVADALVERLVRHGPAHAALAQISRAERQSVAAILRGLLDALDVKPG